MPTNDITPKIGDVILEMQHVTKAFPGVKALSDVNFTLKSGEVHVLVGENGAGKSTLIKLLTGALTLTEGKILLNGQEAHINGTIDAKRLGIAAVYQELTLIPTLSAYENIFIGEEIKKNPFALDRKTMQKRCKEALAQVGTNIDIKIPVGQFGVATQQMIEIAKALQMNAKILILDEPSAVLTTEEIERLMDIIRALKAKGVGIIYISHRMDELKKIGDRVTVLRDGEYVDTLDIQDPKVTTDYLIQLMVGRKITASKPVVDYDYGAELLKLDQVSQVDFLKNINLSLRQGEIVGIAGLVGAGRTELAKVIFGVSKYSEGSIYIKGKKEKIKSPRKAINKGIGLVPEERKTQGLALDLSLESNVIMANLKNVSKKGVINRNKRRLIAEENKAAMNIRTPSIRQKVGSLSGGNQQKVVLAKWLASKCDILIFDEPTRGIDVGAKQEVHDLIRKLAREGKALLVMSSELPEILSLCHRVIVMHEGRIQGNLSIEEATQEKILVLASGGELK